MSWTPISPMPVTDYDSAIVASGKFIHVVGGSFNANRHYMYDTELDVWVAATDVNTSVYSFQPAAHNGSLYFCTSANSLTRIWNPTAGTWSNASNAPVYQNHGWLASDGTNLYRGGASTTAIYRMNSATTWLSTPVSYFPTVDPVEAPGVASLGSTIYFAGGMAWSSYSANFYSWTPSSDTWTELAPLPIATRKPLLATGHPWLYLVGGESFSGPRKEFYRYDPMLDTWTQLEDYPWPIAGHGGGVVDNRLYLVSGYNDDDYMDEGHSHEVGARLLEVEFSAGSFFGPYPVLQSKIETDTSLSGELEEGVEGTLTPYVKGVRSSSLIELTETTDPLATLGFVAMGETVVAVDQDFADGFDVLIPSEASSGDAVVLLVTGTAEVPGGMISTPAGFSTPITRSMNVGTRAAMLFVYVGEFTSNTVSFAPQLGNFPPDPGLEIAVTPLILRGWDSSIPLPVQTVIDGTTLSASTSIPPVEFVNSILVSQVLWLPGGPRGGISGEGMKDQTVFRQIDLEHCSSIAFLAQNTEDETSVAVTFPSPIDGGIMSGVEFLSPISES